MNVKAMVMSLRVGHISYVLSILVGTASFMLGVSVLIGWYTHNAALIQVSELFVPMQYNTALGFVLSGLGILSAARNIPRISALCGTLVMLIGLATLVQYVFNLNFGIDQLLMEHYVAIETSHPGRMAPNTALCFLLTGMSLILLKAKKKIARATMVTGILGSLVIGLGTVALSGYLVGLESAYGWGQLTRMAVHTAVGFVVLGIGIIGLSWQISWNRKARLPNWFPATVGLSVLVFTIFLWQAFGAETSNGTGGKRLSYINEILLVFGIILAVALSLTTYLTQSSRGKAEELTSEIRERQMVEETLQETENTYRSVIATARDGYLLIDMDGRVLDVNDAYIQLSGYSRRELLALNAWDLDARATNTDVRSYLRTLTNVSSALFTSEHRTKSGKLWPVEISTSYMSSDGGRCCSFIRDITERKHLEGQVRRSQKMEAVGQLTGGIAHDFNNILGIILGNLELLQSMLPGNPKALERINKALKGANRGATITRNLLNFSRKEVQEICVTSVNEFIEGLEDLIAKSLTASIRVETHLAKDLWLVEIDPGDLEDTLLNLALNARDAMPEGGDLVIETANKVLDNSYIKNNPGVEAGEFVMISVSDTGTGISKEIMGKILDPFFTTKQQGKGTGLGLSMVYGFVQRSGGHLKIYSEVDRGTTIRIFLPNAQKALSSSLPTVEMGATPPLGTETILVVDDEEALLEVTTSYLENLGYKIHSAKNGPESLKILKNNKDIDLLFSDVIMPGDLDGYQLALEAHKEHPELKIILTSGFTSKHEEISKGDSKYLANLAATLIRKPYNMNTMGVAIRNYLDRK